MRRFASLPRDVARCIGTNCTKRNSCARHKQMGRDTQNPHNFHTVVTDASRGEVCLIRIEEIDDGR